MQRYFVKRDNDNIILNKDDIFHITKVMRSKINDQFEVCDENKVYLCEITSFNPFNFKVIKEIVENNEIDGHIRLLYCVPKGDKLDLVIQKACELGCNEIVLINSERCVRKINNDEFSKKLVRFNKIIKEASEQSKRTKLMKINSLIDYKDINKFNSDESFIAYEKSDSKLLNLEDELKELKGKTINILVGAEGGFSLEEVKLAEKYGYKNITLGARILRSETACFYVLSLFSFYMGLEN